MRYTRAHRFWASPWRLKTQPGRSIPRALGLQTPAPQPPTPQPPAPRPPLVRINDATFYRRQPSPQPTDEENFVNPSLFPNLHFELSADGQQHCAIIGPSNAGKTTFLEILRGQHLAFPPAARSYPYLSSEELLKKDSRLSWPASAIQYVGFSGQTSHGGSGLYISARYESRRESDDFSLLDFLLGKTQLNALEEQGQPVDQTLVDSVINNLRLENLLDMPLGNLSNGQTRRARIAKALLTKPELLLLDEPFMGLDPPTTIQLNPILRDLAYSSSPRLLLALRPQDPIPDWITNVFYLGKTTEITHQGPPIDVLNQLQEDIKTLTAEYKGGQLDEIPRYNNEFGRMLTDLGIRQDPSTLGSAQHERQGKWRTMWNKGIRTEEVKRGLGYGDTLHHKSRDVAVRFGGVSELPPGEPLIEMEGVTVRYGDKAVLGNWDTQYEMHSSLESVDMAAARNLARKQPKREQMLYTPENDAGQDRASGLHWTLCRGQRWAIVGPNGSGKTTLLSLITSDHPQAYALPIKLFGRSRLPSPGQPGLSLFDIQKRIGHASPEVHHFFPRHLSVRATLESAYADTPLSPPKLDANADARVSASLRWFQADLCPAVGPSPLLHKEVLRTEALKGRRIAEPGDVDEYRRKEAEHYFDLDAQNEESIAWAEEMRFSEMTLSGQRVALFLRAIIAQPDIVILDEAFSGMDDVVRDKCLLFLESGERRRQTPFRRGNDLGALARTGLGSEDRLGKEMQQTGITFVGPLMADHQALIVVSHLRQEIPKSVTRWMYLPEGGGQGPGEHPEGPVFATGPLQDTPLPYDPFLWADIWTIPMLPREKKSLEELEKLRQDKLAREEGSASGTEEGRPTYTTAQQTEGKHPGGRPKGWRPLVDMKYKVPERGSPYGVYGRNSGNK